MSLTNAQCKSAKPKEKSYKLSDGEGLYLNVMPNNSKYWRLKYRFAGKEKLLSIGIYPLISLAEAREEKFKAKKLLSTSIDPSLEKQKIKRRATHNSKNTFQIIALEWLEMRKSSVSQGHINTIRSRLEKNIFPFIGHEPIASIEPPDMIYVLKKIEKRGSFEVARRCNQICSQIFRYGIQTGKSVRNPTSDLRGAFKTKQVKHLASISIDELPNFVETLKSNEARLYLRTIRAIWLSLYTFARPGELRKARWEHIDFTKERWIIPAEMMKMNKDHIVPLSKQALEILRRQTEETGHINTPWVFPSQVSPLNPMSDGTVNKAVKLLGFEGRMTAHGFRALARTAIREELDYPPDVIEVQLAHKPCGPLGAAYDRAQFLKQRKIMMQEWADYISLQQQQLYPITFKTK